MNSTTDFEREILADGIVTRAEYDEINQRLVACVSDAEQTLTLIAQGDYYVYSIPYSDESDGTFMECQSANGSALAGLYVDTLTNPDNIDPDELMLQCLKREGLLPEDFTLDQYRAGNGSLVLGSDGEISEVSEWALPFSDEQPGFIACTINPSAGTSK